MKFSKKILALIVCFVLVSTSFGAYAKIFWNGTAWEENGDTTLPPLSEGKVLWLPVSSLLSQAGIEHVENEGVLTSGAVTIANGSPLVNNNGTIQVATLAPKIMNGVLYAPQKLIERIFPLSVRSGKDGSVTVTVVGDKGDDDSWFYAMGLTEPVKPDKSAMSPSEIVVENIRLAFYKPTAKPEKCWEEMLPDGSFPDLDYKSDDKNSWDPGKHVERLASLTAVLYTPTNPLYHDPVYMEKLRTSTEFWVAGKFINPGWWWNERGVTTRFQNMCIFDISDLGLKEDTYKEVMARSIKYGTGATQQFQWRPEGNSGNSSLRPYYGTGSGPATRVIGSFKALCSDLSQTKEEKDQIVSDCLQGLSYELSLELYAAPYKPDGAGDAHTQSIKADKSYHEHGNQHLTTTYGASMLTETYLAMSYAEGSGILLTKEGAIGLRDVLLDGFRYFYKNNYPTWTTGAREFSITKNPYSSNGIKGKLFLCDYLLRNFPELDRRDELLDFRRMISMAEQGEHFDGTRFFWQSDLLSHHRAKQDFLFSVQGVSNRIETPEKTNNAGLKNKYMANGCYELLKTGKEFWGIAPVLDWRKLPGITVAQDETFSLDVPASRKGTTSFCGGLSDGEYGFSTYDMNEDEVTAKKSWFCFDNEIVCLGAGITSSNENAVYTSMNQTRLSGDVLTDKGKLTEEFNSFNDCKWILHQGVGYVPFVVKGEQTIEVEAGPRTGSWNEINSEKAVDDIATFDIFLTGINHGGQPDGETYHYAILPDTDENRIKNYVNNVPYSVVANTDEKQSVYHKETDVFMTVFHTAGTVTAPNGQTVKVDNPCVVMLRNYKDGSYQVTAANPYFRELDLTVELSGKVSKKILFELQVGEKGNEAGMAVMYESKTQQFVKSPNVLLKEDGESSEIAEIWAITVNGELVEDSFLESSTHTKTITISELPEIKAKGNYPAQIDIDDSRAIISIIDPNNPYNRCDYRIQFTWKEKSE